ncbi:MAG: hypothetical protein U0984_06605 [Prosthecobacter sp.]|nr:hypothetical protein [Prosthecobacter sp.]
MIGALAASGLMPRLLLSAESPKTVWGIAELFEWVLQWRQTTGQIPQYHAKPAGKP